MHEKSKKVTTQLFKGKLLVPVVHKNTATPWADAYGHFQLHKVHLMYVLLQRTHNNLFLFTNACGSGKNKTLQKQNDVID